MAYGGPADYEWEEVEGDDWDVLCVDGDEQKPGVPTTGIEFTLEDTGPLRRVKRSITKREREAAASVHRSHVLCLAARAVLLDWAAEQPEVQATALSLLPPAAALRNQSAEEPQRAINGMLPLVTWFRGAFAVLPPDLVWRQQEGGGSGRLRLEDHMDQQLLRATRSQAGTVECLVATFVSLVRAQGGSARVVRLLDAVPLAPWRARPVTIRTAAAPPASGGGVRRPLDLEAGDELPGAAGPGPGSRGGAGRGAGGAGKKGRRLEDVLAAGRGGRGGGKGTKRKAQAGSSGKGGSEGGDGASRSQSGPTALDDGDGGEQAAGGARRASKRARGKAAAQEEGGSDSGGKEGAPAAGAAASTVGGSMSNKGEEEFERQLQMAILATGREAQARTTGGRGNKPSAGAATSATTATKGTASPGAAKKAVALGLKPPRPKQGNAGGGGGGGVAAEGSVGFGFGGAATPVGTAMSVRPEVVVNCWAEVYCGSVDRGRWVAVDVVNGYVDRPELIDTATFRPTPVCYVVASERGALLDVTARYCHNLLAAQCNRDEAWWATTTAGFQGAAAATAIAKPDGNNHRAMTGPVQEPDGGGVDVGSSGQGSGSGSGKVALGVGRGSGEAAGAAGRGGPRIIDARLSHQRGENDNPAGPYARGGAGPFDADGPADTAAGGGRMAGTGPDTTAAAGAGGGGDLRAVREAAELQHRGLSQLQGLPTSIEGFKSHPMYLLKRHIGKYEALRPGTAPLGLHRGEPYYPRAQLSVLHTVERWRREGRQVRDGELRSPAKVVKKRAVGPPGVRRMAAPAGTGAGGTTHGGGKRKGRGGGGGEEGSEDEDDIVLAETAGDDPGAAVADGPTINLYGKWQTDEWVPPTAEGGVVPKNERGNVECPPLVPALPRGTVHLTLGPGLGGLCRTLGLDYAPGLVGFEVQGGRMVPRLEGVVVCEEVAEIVVAAYVERESARGAAAAARRRRTAVAAWLRLLGSMRIRLQLERDYAGSADEADPTLSARAGPGMTGGTVAAAAVAAAVAEAEARRIEGGKPPRGAVAAVKAAQALSVGGVAKPSAAEQILERLGAEGAAAAANAGAAEGTGADVEVEEF